MSAALPGNGAPLVGIWVGHHLVGITATWLAVNNVDVRTSGNYTEKWLCPVLGALRKTQELTHGNRAREFVAFTWIMNCFIKNYKKSPQGEQELRFSVGLFKLKISKLLYILLTG